VDRLSVHGRGQHPDISDPFRVDEAVYGNMPPFGLGKAGRLVPASESSSARDRLAVSQE
jgi:hypothetical protein